MNEKQKRQLADIVSPIIREMTGDIFAARLEVAIKIIEGIEAEGWVITPPKPKRRSVAGFWRLFR
jgi:hypothetical protein